MVSEFHRWLKRRRIAVLLGGNSAERPISIKTGRAIFQSLKRQGFRAVALDAARSLPDALRKNKIDFAYIALHGTGGEDGCVQGLLEWMKIPYTGSGVFASAAAMDKAAAKRLFESARIPTARWYALNKPRPLTREEMSRPAPDCGGHPRGGMGSRLGYPVVVKPASQGSAVGVSVVKKESEWPKALMNAFQFDRTVLVEEFLKGPEITVGVLGRQALPVIEILPQHGRPFYDFHAKYAPGGSRHVLPARISAAQARRASQLAVDACRILNTRAAARVDFIVDAKRGPCILEVNTIPGMTQTSLLPEAARAVGMNFDSLVLQIAEQSVGS